MNIQDIIRQKISQAEQLAMNHRDAMLRAEGGAYALDNLLKELELCDESEIEEPVAVEG